MYRKNVSYILQPAKSRAYQIETGTAGFEGDNEHAVTCLVMELSDRSFSLFAAHTAIQTDRAQLSRLETVLNEIEKACKLGEYYCMEFRSARNDIISCCNLVHPLGCEGVTHSSSFASRSCCMRDSTLVLDTKSVFWSQFLGVRTALSDDADWLRADFSDKFAE